MSAVAHTPGFWFVALDQSHPAEYAIDVVVDDVTKHIALVHLIGSDDETEANAKVLAAAPDLLAAAKLAKAVLARGKWLETSTDPEAVALRALSAAIDKAELRLPEGQ